LGPGPGESRRGDGFNNGFNALSDNGFKIQFNWLFNWLFKRRFNKLFNNLFDRL
jgi:hypothetical protein